jgi:1-acyl-sn-glycerol-3-phosphate acyltransferase
MSQQAQPPLGFIAPQYNAWITKIVHRAVPLWMRQTTDVQAVEAVNIEELVRAYSQFEAGKIRLVLAFRHPSVNDPMAIGYLFSQLVPKAAKRAGVKLHQPIHAHFMYDRGVPLWAGKTLGWLFSRMGGTSILRGKLDRQGLKSARNLLVNGQLPFMAAPEGATNGHSEIVAPLEPGVAQLAFWGAEDLAKADRPEPVVILPIGLQYSYSGNHWPAIEALLTDLETQAGIAAPDAGQVDQQRMYQRLSQLGEQLLTMMERHYDRFYHQTLPTLAADIPAHAQLAARMQRLLEIALTVCESSFGLTAKGSDLS